jgi:hypothetical protein
LIECASLWQDESGRRLWSFSTVICMLLPALLDLVGTGFAKFGLMYCTVSLYQLARSAVMIIVALIKTCILGEHLSSSQWWGTGINTLAMLMVGLTSILGGSDLDLNNSRDPKIGLCFLMLSCVACGTQYVLEEKIMQDGTLDPVFVVGTEGFWGALLVPLVVFPLACFIPGNDIDGSLENFEESLVMISSNPAIANMLLAFIVTVFLYNVFALFVTNLFSSIWHVILDNFRPIAVWGTDLVVFYAVTAGRFGEPWTRWSNIEMAGMLLLLLGTAVYHGSVSLPWLDYRGDYVLLPSSETHQGHGDKEYEKKEPANIDAVSNSESIVVVSAGRNSRASEHR